MKIVFDVNVNGDGRHSRNHSPNKSRVSRSGNGKFRDNRRGAP